MLSYNFDSNELFSTGAAEAAVAAEGSADSKDSSRCRRSSRLTEKVPRSEVMFDAVDSAVVGGLLSKVKRV